MINYLFADFLNDSREYEQAEAFWREQWDDLVRRVGQEQVWETPWANTYSANGTPIQDGNPIFSAISPRRRLAVRVIQLEPADDPEELAAWMDTFAKGEPESVEELVITCVLTNETLHRAVELMRQWITEEKVQLPQDTEEQLPCPNPAETTPTSPLSSSDRPA